MIQIDEAYVHSVDIHIEGDYGGARYVRVHLDLIMPYEEWTAGAGGQYGSGESLQLVGPQSEVNDGD